MHDVSNIFVNQLDSASHKDQYQCVVSADGHNATENTRSPPIDVSEEVATSHTRSHLHSSGQSTAHLEKTPADLDHCCVQCGSLLAALKHLTAMEIVLDGDLRAESYEPALHSVWLARQACERARRFIQQTFSVAPAHLAGQCVVLQQYYTLVDDLDAWPLGEGDDVGRT